MNVVSDELAVSNGCWCPSVPMEGLHSGVVRMLCCAVLWGPWSRALARLLHAEPTGAYILTP